MIAKKIISTLAAFSIMSSFCVGAISVSAAATDTTPFKLEYVEVEGAATRTVNVYYADEYAEVGTLGFDLQLDFPSASVVSVAITDATGGGIVPTDKSGSGFCKAG